ncbi:hypothetical protein Mgra_00007771 [Meloidogyne graminicola]|uniref:Uncharacterized protein n=1 Tax=Meloidogyne graminicola TaxID=189291 RepID=A0A8S9ZI04_9BILA|nr:hypothetical protein Mgra_00007771 [Meloidogyne graminicola]
MSKDLFVENKTPPPAGETDFYYVGAKDVDKCLKVAFAKVVMEGMKDERMFPEGEDHRRNAYRIFAENKNDGDTQKKK